MKRYPATPDPHPTAAPSPHIPRALAVVLFLFAVGGRVAAAADPPDFDREIAPLLAAKCLSCHDDREAKGGLNLAARDAALKGGDSGAVLVPGRLDESYLWDRVAGDEMPPKHPLNDEEKDLLRQWIAGGARWGTDPIDPFRYTTDKRAGYDWWSLQPVRRPDVPPIDGAAPRNPIDGFIRRQLDEMGISPSPPADRRTLLRRLSYGLTGLPPTPEETAAFVADSAPDAYERLVDRLLQSEHYGERWARHWLDLARFGESQGFERDKIRLNAWPYRDWVIRALNQDLPYDEFTRLQLAGDILRPDDGDAVTATGFLVAAPYDEVGQSQQSLAMRAVVRQDELEDIVGTVGQTFLGLTVNCARCHAHKFDPISQTEYYRLVSALDGVRHGERPVSTPAIERDIAGLQLRRRLLREQIDGLLEPIRRQILAERDRDPAVLIAPEPFARWTFDADLSDEIGDLDGTAHGGAKLADGRLIVDGKGAYVTTPPLSRTLTEKTLEAWVQLDNLDQRGGGAVSLQTTDGHLFDAIVFGEREPGQWMSGSNGFVRTQSFQAPRETEAHQQVIHVAIVYKADGTIVGYRNGEPYGQAYQSDGPQTFEAGKSQVIFGLRHGTSAGGNRMLAAAIDQAHLYDRALTPDAIAASAGRRDYVSRAQLLARLTDEQREQLGGWEQESAGLTGRINRLSDFKVYAVTPRPAEVTHVLLRGNPASPAEAVSPGGIAAVGRGGTEFNLPPDGPEGPRRVKLAEWITSADNPLFARVIVNRLWHYHFGTGLVDSPNDFGFNGGRPSHPELLDFLAAYLVDHNYSLKAVHRLIVTSDTYRQSSRPRPEGLQADAGNRLLWRFAPQRLDAEVLRDTILTVSGQLNPQVGGPPYRDFKTFTFNSQFYEIIDPVGYEFNRRTIYRMWIRSGRNPFLDAFDCPDPSTTSPERAVTTTPTQSLSLLNNAFVLRMSDRFAERVANEAGSDLETQVRRAFELVYQRPPGDDETRRVAEFVRRHGLPALARVLFNSNEFLFAE